MDEPGGALGGATATRGCGVPGYDAPDTEPSHPEVHLAPNPTAPRAPTAGSLCATSATAEAHGPGQHPAAPPGLRDPAGHPRAARPAGAPDLRTSSSSEPRSRAPRGGSGSSSSTPVSSSPPSSGRSCTSSTDSGRSGPTRRPSARYHRYFPRPDGKLIGEKTPEYLSCPWVPPMVAPRGARGARHRPAPRPGGALRLRPQPP